MEQATQVFADYAAAFEQTYADDNWSRLADFFSEDARYEIRGGPFACKIAGRDAIFAGLKKSIDGFDRRCSERQIELTAGPDVVETENGHEVSIAWNVTYQYKDAPGLALPGRSVFTVADGVIVAMRDEYDDAELESVEAWMREYGAGLDASYV
jgi:hypothetical protein